MSRLPEIVETLSITEIADEVIVYDTKTSKAYCLNALGGQVLCACRDGLKLQQVTAKIGSTEITASIIAELHSLGLLNSSKCDWGRRQVMTTVSTAVASVVVASVATPEPAAAASATTLCILDSSNTPCNCDRCGQSCSNRSWIDTCALPYPPGSTPLPKGICSFLYQRRPASWSCLGDRRYSHYTCYNNLLNYHFAIDCNEARKSVADYAFYLCCRCSGAPVTTTC